MHNEIIKGTISRLYIATPNFSAGVIDSQNRESGPFKFTAPVQLVAGTRVVMPGKWVQDKKYGTQFKADSVEYDMTLDAHGLALWLAKNPALKGIGRAKAEKIGMHFGENFDDVITNRPEEIQELAKLSDESMDLLKALWIDYRDYHKLITWLAGFGLSIHEIEQIKNKYGEAAIGILQADPYAIIGEIERFQFKRVDAIALKTGVPKNHESRIEHGILWCVKDALNEGSTIIEYDQLVILANKLLELDQLNSKDMIKATIAKLVNDGKLRAHLVSDKRVIIDPDIAEKEEYLCRIFKGISVKQHPSFQGVPLQISEWLPSGDKQLNEDQHTAVLQAFKHPISLISGGAGSGKTFTIDTITKIYEQHLEKTVALCAPTGKAARRMEEATGHPASTIHRLLEYHPFLGWQRNKDNPIKADLVIVDEVSMVDSILGWHLFQAIDLKKTAVVLVGDHNQLPPVGPGNILRDVIQTESIPTTILTHVVRQAGILKYNCTGILEGTIEPTFVPKKGESSFIPWQVVKHLTETEECRRFLGSGFAQILESWPDADIIHGIQILSPQKKGPLGCDALNIMLQRITQKIKWNVAVDPVDEGKRPKFYLMDKVIQIKNDYDPNVDVMNGTLGQVIEIMDDGEITVEFEGKDKPVTIPADKRNNLALAYALTIHKCQGSEFPMVLLVIHKQHNFMHTRNLLYTGATRAKKKLIIMGDGWGIRNCAAKVAVDKRQTWLRELLKQGKDNATD